MKIVGKHKSAYCLLEQMMIKIDLDRFTISLFHGPLERV